MFVAGGSILYIILFLLETLIGIYDLCVSIGHLLISIIIWIYGTFSKTLLVLYEALCVLKADYEIFENDVSSVIYPIFLWINELLNILGTSLCSGCLQVVSTTTCLKTALHSLLYDISHILKSFTYVINESIDLVIEALTLIGHGLCQCCNLLFLFLETLFMTPYSFVLLMQNGIERLLLKISIILKNEAFYGLIVLSSFLLVMWKTKVYKKIALKAKQLFLISSNSAELLINLIFMSVGSVAYRINKIMTNNIQNIRQSYRTDSPVTSKKNLELQRLLEQEKAEKLCIVCVDQKRNTMLLNCKHLVLCNNCVSIILDETPLCPVCREYISEVITVYT